MQTWAGCIPSQESKSACLGNFRLGSKIDVLSEQFSIVSQVSLRQMTSTTGHMLLRESAELGEESDKCAVFSFCATAHCC